MKPRIFVSSTFYDLKHVREDLSSFIKQYSFEPIMFEDGDIGYTPNKHLDQSCYDTMHNTDMVILIIGGQYGSAATGEAEDKFKEYLSVTRKEFQTAYSKGIPIFVFIESTVYTEYEIYSINREAIETQKNQILFSATKSLNVFRFIREIKGIGNIPIMHFEKVNSIKNYLSKQWADMFKLYLHGLRDQKEIVLLQETVNEMQNFIKRMNIMLDGIGQKIFNSSSNISYDYIQEKQTQLELNDICDKISNSFLFSNCYTDVENRRNFISDLLDVVKGLQLPDIAQKGTEPLSLETQLGKDITAMLTISLIRNKFKIRSTNNNILSCIYSLQEHLKSPEAYQYLVEELTKDRYFCIMFDTLI